MLPSMRLTLSQVCGAKGVLLRGRLNAELICVVRFFITQVPILFDLTSYDFVTSKQSCFYILKREQDKIFEIFYSFNAIMFRISEPMLFSTWLKYIV